MYVKKLRPILTRRKLEQLLLAASKARFFLNRCFDFWKKKRNRPKKKKSIDLVSNWCHDKTNSNLAGSVPYSVALTKQQQENCVIISIIKLAANTTIRWLHCLAKQRFLLFFAQRKISERYPWKTDVISRKRSANRQKQPRNNAPRAKTSQSAKNQLDPAKVKIGPKCYICPFCKKDFNY